MMRSKQLSTVLLSGLLLAACTTDSPNSIDDPSVPPADNAAGGGMTRPAAGEPARNDLANQLGVDPAEVTIVSAVETQWPDACLGLAQDNEMCAQVVTPGYDVTLSYNGTEYRYRTDIDGNAVRMQQ